ncbi:CYTH domain-containing protein [Martelella alba]|uniref:CYTH domain-containing protein n=1 Tax=Martelella alba TaxID=2590451 RepID=A0A506UFW2_9HYPH|nr:CYTH domain-containing protein [Martelella alba]TPW32506.1 CYTH domain-containing protein [Martelella alba]
MAREIERKFLIRNADWEKEADDGVRLTQAYLAGGRDRSVRIRLFDGKAARLTLKFGGGTFARDEFEYDVPLDDARQMLTHATGIVIDKTRYKVERGAFTYEIDVFHGDHDGLIVAEVELPDENAEPPLPDWLGREVTGDRRYLNQSLSKRAGLPEEI